MSLYPALRGNTRPGGARNCGNAKNSGQAPALGEETPRASRRPVEEKKVEKEAFQVKLLGSEKPRFREMTRGGRTHGVQGTLLASTAPARRGCATAGPCPGNRHGPTWSSAAPAERAGPLGFPECAPQLPAAAVHARAPPPVPRVPR